MLLAMSVKILKKKLNKINHLEYWPPNSPDLSPIETVWSLMQSKLEGKTIKNIKELKKYYLYGIGFMKNITKKFVTNLLKVLK
jgi:transposase